MFYRKKVLKKIRGEMVFFGGVKNTKNEENGRKQAINIMLLVPKDLI